MRCGPPSRFSTTRIFWHIGRICTSQSLSVRRERICGRQSSSKIIVNLSHRTIILPLGRSFAFRFTRTVPNVGMGGIFVSFGLDRVVRLGRRCQRLFFLKAIGLRSRSACDAAVCGGMTEITRGKSLVPPFLYSSRDTEKNDESVLFLRGISSSARSVPRLSPRRTSGCGLSDRLKITGSS